MHTRALYFLCMDRIGPKKPTQWFLKEHRMARGWSVRELARRMETSPATISKLENGVQIWDSSWLARAAFAFGYDEPQRLLRSPDAPSFVDILQSATPEQRQQVIDFARFLLKAS